MFFATFIIRTLNSGVARQMARLGFIFYFRRDRDSNPRQSVEFHQTGPLKDALPTELQRCGFNNVDQTHLAYYYYKKYYMRKSSSLPIRFELLDKARHC